MDFTIGGLARGIFGTKKWMAQLERDRLKQKPKATAVRANGKNGSRKRKTAAASSTARRSRKQLDPLI